MSVTYLTSPDQTPHTGLIALLNTGNGEAWSVQVARACRAWQTLKANRAVIVAVVLNDDDALALQALINDWPEANVIINRRPRPNSVLLAQGRWLAGDSQHWLWLEQTVSEGEGLLKPLGQWGVQAAQETMRELSAAGPSGSKMPTELAVVVPAHNCGAYLIECLDSVLAAPSVGQLVVVDDGSTDDSHALLTEYTQQNIGRLDHITVRHATGLPALARNVGLCAVNAKAVGFVDGDDWVDSTAYETLWQHLQNTGADIVSAQGFWAHEGDQVREHEISYVSHSIYHAADTLQSTFFSSVWNRLYSVELLRNGGMHFPAVHYSEDFCFSVWTHLHARKTSLVPVQAYHYRAQRAHSSTAGRGGAQGFAHIDDFDREWQIYQTDPLLSASLSQILKKRLGSFAYTLSMMPTQLTRPFQAELRQKLHPWKDVFHQFNPLTRADEAVLLDLALLDWVYTPARATWVACQHRIYRLLAAALRRIKPSS